MLTRVGFSKRRENRPSDRCHLPTPRRYTPLTGVADARPSWSTGQRPAEEPWHRCAGRVRWRGRAVAAAGVGPRPVPRRAHAHALGAGPHPVRCHALAHAAGAGSRPVSRHVHGLARPSCLWPGERRPKCATDHRPRAGSRAPVAPGSLAPCRCHSPHPDLLASPLHRPSSASCRPSTDLSAACHREHGLPTATPLARPALTTHRKPTLLRDRGGALSGSQLATRCVLPVRAAASRALQMATVRAPSWTLQRVSPSVPMASIRLSSIEAWFRSDSGRSCVSR